VYNAVLGDRVSQEKETAGEELPSTKGDRMIPFDALQASLKQLSVIAATLSMLGDEGRAKERLVVRLLSMVYCLLEVLNKERKQERRRLLKHPKRDARRLRQIDALHEDADKLRRELQDVHDSLRHTDEEPDQLAAYGLNRWQSSNHLPVIGDILECPNCKGENLLRDYQDNVDCPYCGSRFRFDL
jgi:hypothetical protein